MANVFFKKGDEVVCIDAKEPGIPLEEGKTYTVKTVWRRTENSEIPELVTAAGCTVVEVEGRFLQRRFKSVHDLFA